MYYDKFGKDGNYCGTQGCCPPVCPPPERKCPLPCCNVCAFIDWENLVRCMLGIPVPPPPKPRHPVCCVDPYKKYRF